MPAIQSNLSILDGANTARSIEVLDISGIGNGPFIPVHASTNSAGNMIDPATNQTLLLINTSLASNLQANVINFPSTQNVVGNVVVTGFANVGNFPLSQNVVVTSNVVITGNVNASVSGISNVGNFPISQNVVVTSGAITATVSGAVTVTSGNIAAQANVINWPATVNSPIYVNGSAANSTNPVPVYGNVSAQANVLNWPATINSPLFVNGSAANSTNPVPVYGNVAAQANVLNWPITSNVVVTSGNVVIASGNVAAQANVINWPSLSNTNLFVSGTQASVSNPVPVYGNVVMYGGTANVGNFPSLSNTNIFVGGSQATTGNPVPVVGNVVVTSLPSLPAFASTPTFNLGTSPIALETGGNLAAILAKLIGPATSSATPTTASSIVLKAAPGNLLSLVVVATTTAGFIMLFDSLTAPVDGAVTPKWVFPISPNGALGEAWIAPLIFATGIVAVYSSTGPFTKTASATAFISGQVQ